MEPPNVLAGAEDERPLRINLPLRYHMELHRLKLLSGKRMATVVAEALELYFDHQQRPPGPQTRLPP